MNFLTLKSSHEDLSNEGSNFILSLLEAGHWVAQTRPFFDKLPLNYRFWPLTTILEFNRACLKNLEAAYDKDILLNLLRFDLNVKIDYAATFGMPIKVLFSEFYKDWASLYIIFKVKIRQLSSNSQNPSVLSISKDAFA